jgi:drug/metabolite transporter, DME family
MDASILIVLSCGCASLRLGGARMTERTEDHFGTGVGFVLLATLGWSLSGLFVRFLPHLNVWQINCWRGYWMAVALICYLVARYGADFPIRVRQIPRQALWTSAICFALGTTFYVASLTLTTTATVSVIGAMSPLVAALLSPWITGEKPGFLTWIAASLALVGAAVIGWDGLRSGHVLGIITSFAVPFTFALQTLLLRRYRTLDMMPAIALGGILAFVGAGFAPLLLNAIGLANLRHTTGFDIDLQSLGVLMLMGPVQLAIPLIFYGIGARSVQGVTLALLSMIDAVLNPLWPLLVFGEIPDRLTVIGGCIILGAVLLSIFGGHINSYSRRLSTR